MFQKPLRIDCCLLHKTVSCWALTPAQAEHLQRLLPACQVDYHTNLADFAAAMPKTEIAISWGFKQSWVDAAAHLRWLVTPAAGKDYFSVTLPDTVKMINGSFHGPLMAETVLGMMLGHCRGLFLTQQLTKQTPWPRGTLDQSMRSLHGSHTVILGYGHIGGAVGRMLKPLGVRLTGVRRSLGERPAEFSANDRIITTDQLDTVLPEADHLVMVLPGGRGTDQILDAARIGLLPRHAAIYNVGRGNAIDEAALAAALTNKQIAAAYLDVFATEPLPEDAPLRACENALLMPHASAITPIYLDRFIEEIASRIRDHFGVRATG